MTRRAILPILLILLSGLGWGQLNTSVTLQVTDTPDAQSWNNGSWIATLYPPSTSGPYTYIGDGVVPNVIQSGPLSSTGGATMTLANNNAIAPANSTWQFTVCPQATAPCFTTNTTISGASQTVTIAPPSIRISTQGLPYRVLAYTTTEIPNPDIGFFFYNLTCGSQQLWNGTAWSGCSGFTQNNLFVSPTSLNFGTVSIGQSAQQTITLCGGAGTTKCNIPNTIAVNITGYSVNDPVDTSNPFTLNSSQCPSVIQPGASCPIVVTFTPTSAITYCNQTPNPCNISIASSATNNPQTITLAGIGSSTSAPTLSTISVAPSTASITIGNTQQFAAVETFSDGSITNPTSLVTWSPGNTNPAVLTLTNTGKNHTTNSSSTTCSSAPITNNFNNLIIIDVYYQNASTTPTINLPTDTQGNTYKTAVGPITSSGQQVGEEFYTVAKATQANTVTVTDNNTNLSYFGCILREYSGTNANLSTVFDAGTGQKNPGAATTAMTSGTFTCSQSSDLGSGFFLDNLAAAGTFTATGGMTREVSDTVFPAGNQDIVSGITGTQTATATDTSSTTNWIAIGSCYSPASQGSSVDSITSSGLALGLNTGTATVLANPVYFTQNTCPASNPNSGVTALSCTWKGPIAQNDSLLLVVNDDTNSATYPVSITDSCGNTFVNLVSKAQVTGPNQQQQVYWVPTSLACATDSLTVNFGGGGATSPTVTGVELNGITLTTVGANADVVVSSTGNTATAMATISGMAQVSEAAVCAVTGNNFAPSNVNIVNTSGAIVSSPGVQTLTSSPNSGAIFMQDLFNTSTLTATATFSSPTSNIMSCATFKTATLTGASLTVTSGNGVIYNEVSQQPITTGAVFYPSTIWTATIPGDVGSHLQANSAAVISNIFNNGSVGQNLNCIASTPQGTGTCDGNNQPFYYSSQKDPIFCSDKPDFAPSQIANNPNGICFHLWAGAQFSSTVNDQYWQNWDQSTDIDPTPNGRLITAYNFNQGVITIPAGCTCNTVTCAKNPANGCIVHFHYADYNHQYSDPLQGIMDGVASTGLNAGSGVGLIRDNELIGGVINHAIQLDVGCVTNSPVFPGSGSETVCPNQTNAPAIGNLIYIDASYNCGLLAAWDSPVCVALQQHGGYISATQGGSFNGLNVAFENPIGQHLFGMTDPLPIMSFLNGFSGGPSTDVNCTGSPVTRCNINFINDMPGVQSHLHVADQCIAKRLAGLPKSQGAC